MKEVITKFLLIVVSVLAITGFVYTSLWSDTKDVRDRTHTLITNANGNTPTAGTPQ